MENKNNKSLKTKLSNTFNGAKETIKNTSEAIKQGAEKIGTGLTKTAAGIVIGASLLTGCAQINDPMQYEEQPAIEQELQVFSEAGTPCDNIVNGFKFHNFFGQEPDIEYETMNQDVAKYLKAGADFLNQELNNFEKSLDGRLQAQHYFNHTTEWWHIKFIDRAKEEVINPVANSSIDGDKDFLPFLDGLATASTDPIRDFIGVLNNNDERVYFLALYKFLSTHAGEKVGLGNKCFEQNTALQDSYQAKIAATLDYASSYLPDIKKLESLIDNNNGKQSINIQKVTAEMYKILDKNAHKVNPEVTANDLMFPVYFSTYGSSLLIPHNYFVDIGYHQDKPHNMIEGTATFDGPQKWINRDMNYFDPADRMINYAHGQHYFINEVEQSTNQETEQTM